MPLLHLLEWIAGHHLIPAVLASCLIYLWLAAILHLVRARRPADQVPFLYAGLVKACIAVWTGERMSCFASPDPRQGYAGLRLPNLIPTGSLSESLHAPPTAADSWHLATLLLGGLALGLLCYRWSRIAPIYRRLQVSRQARPWEFPKVFEIFEDLVARSYGPHSRSPRPRLVVIHDTPCPAFTMGIRPPVVVLSAKLATELAARELTGVLAHEIGHIRRWDYLARWLATILRDVMLWNPFVLVWYQWVLDRQEKASDAYAAELAGGPEAVASGLVEVGAYLSGMAPISMGPLAARATRRDLRQLGERVDLLLEYAAAPRPRRGVSRAALAAGLVAFVAVQPHAMLSLPYVYQVLRHIL
jgi:Zn-dependent protease with chaperone function